jgi:hypothetical protein
VSGGSGGDCDDGGMCVGVACGGWRRCACIKRNAMASLAISMAMVMVLVLNFDSEDELTNGIPGSQRGLPTDTPGSNPVAWRGRQPFVDEWDDSVQRLGRTKRSAHRHAAWRAHWRGASFPAGWGFPTAGSCTLRPPRAFLGLLAFLSLVPGHWTSGSWTPARRK